MTIETEHIWATFSDRLLAFIHTRVNDDADAKDILQDVFVKIHQNITHLKDQNKLVTWIYQVTRNAIIDYYRSRKTNVPIQEKMEELDLADNLNAEFLGCLKSFTSHLNPKYQEAIQATVYGGMSQKEFAEHHHLSYSAAKSRVQRARAALQDLVYQCCAVETDKYGNIVSAKKDDCNC